MSAIAGVFRRDGAPACEGDLRPVLDAMAPRIRGEWIVWSSGAVVLAASQPVDASGAEPPFARGRDGVARVADARLDGETAAPASPDAERDAVLDAYQSGNLGRLAGDLAVAVWDAERRRVTCARDALGTKPLYFAESESSFAFATEPRALARLPGVDSTPDPAAIAWHLALRPFGAQRSFYRGVRPVPPGARVTCDARGVRIDPPVAIEPRLDDLTRDAAAERLRALLERAVARRLPTDARWGVSLSGGLDSSAIAGLAARTAPPSIGRGRAYTATFDASPECDERDYALEVCGFAGLDAVPVSGESVGPLDAYDRLADRLPGPWLTPNLHLVSSVYAAAAADGVRVLLDGHDGDTVVSHGLDYLPELLRRLRIVEYLRRGTPVARALGWSRRAMVRAHARRVLRHSGVGRALGVAPAAVASTSLLNADLATSVRVDERPSAVEDPYPDERSAHACRVQSGMLAYMSEAAAAAAASVGVDCRHPFLDSGVVEACLAVRPDLKLGGGLTRLPLRDAVAGAIPERVRLRPQKTRLGAQFRWGLLRHDRERLRGLAHGDVGALAEYVDMARFAKLWEDLEAGRPGGEMSVWAAATLGVWLSKGSAR